MQSLGKKHVDHICVVAKPDSQCLEQKHYFFPWTLNGNII